MTNQEIVEKLKNINIYKTRLMVFLKNHEPELYAAILENTKFLDESRRKGSEIPFAERLYCLRNDISEPVACPVCGQPVRFNTDTGSYRKSCSTSCSRKTDETMSKFRETLSKKDDPFNVEQARKTRYEKNGGKWHAGDFVEKLQQSLLMNHGDPHWNNQDQLIATSLERYGVDHPMKCESVRTRQKERVSELYGTDCVFKLGRVRKGSKLGIRRRAWRQVLASQDVRPITPENEFMLIKDLNSDDCVEFKCMKCGKSFRSYWNDGHARPCPHCSNFSHGSSDQEKDLVEFITKVSNGKYTVLTKNKANRTVIPPKEIDIVVMNGEKIALGVEYDGLYWHCESQKGKKYCLEKTESCKSKGVRLIHVFENEWLSKRQIVESRIMNILGIFDRTAYARNCEIAEVDAETSLKFQTETHIQGPVNASVNLGLFYEGGLVALMTFGKCRFDKKHEWEMLRFCCKLGWHIPGAAGRLLKRFERTYRPKSLVTYADRRWSQGKLYQALGFKYDHASQPNYWYFRNNDTRFVYSRVSFQKHRLKDALKSFDPSKTEIENMKANGYSRIFDCGNMVFEKTY